MTIKFTPHKYALIKNHVLDQGYKDDMEVKHAISLLESKGVIDWGMTSETEFFVMRLKDKYADDALYRYSLAAAQDGEGDYARAVEEMANRAGAANPHCKKPD